MAGRSGGAGKMAGFVLLLLVVLFALTIVAGRPVVSYAKSGSMEPTIGTFDGFFIEPWPRHLAVGDIIVFESLARGEPTVHRIVGGDARGWYTQGDANPGTDQAGSEPIVTPERIRGRVVTDAQGDPILLRGVGVPIVEAKTSLARVENGVGGHSAFMALLLFVLAAATALPALLGRRALPRPSKPLPRRVQRALRRRLPRGILGRHVALALLLVVMGAAAWASAGAATDVPSTMVVVRDGATSDGTRALGSGQVVERELRVGSLGPLPTVALLEARTEHVRVLTREVQVPAWSHAPGAFEQEGGREPGVQEDVVRVWRYPRLLPTEVLVGLHGAAPGSPYALLAAGFAAAGWTWVRLSGIGRVPVGRWFGMREGWL